jgi:cyclophilin family peptidyl-prolyl cis-trans isomerase
MKNFNKALCYSLIIVTAVFGLTVVCPAEDKPAAPAPASPDMNDANKPKAQQPAEPNKIAQEKKMVKLETTKGDIVIELNETAAPVTSANFLKYVQEGFFDGTIFHRVIPGFMIQGGGFTPEMIQKATHAPITNEAKNGLKNDRGTIAMARTNDPDSATGQFFINLVSNGPLNYSGPRNPGYAVFGKVTEGMDVVDAIATVQTSTKGFYENVPVEPVIIKSAKIVKAK